MAQNLHVICRIVLVTCDFFKGAIDEAFYAKGFYPD